MKISKTDARMLSALLWQCAEIIKRRTDKTTELDKARRLKLFANKITNKLKKEL